MGDLSFFSSLGSGGGGYILSPATETQLGGIMIGDGLAVDTNGVASVALAFDSIPTNESVNPVTSGGVYSALALKAPLASPALTGTPTAPTATAGTDTTQIATTAFVKAAVDTAVQTAIEEGMDYADDEDIRGLFEDTTGESSDGGDATDGGDDAGGSDNGDSTAGDGGA